MPTDVTGNVVGLPPVTPPSRDPQVGAVGGRTTLPVGGAALTPPGELDAPVPEAALAEVVSSLNDHVQAVRRDLQFSVDEDSGRQVIKVLDTETQELIRQIPAEEILSLVKRIDDLEGLILQVQV